MVKCRTIACEKWGAFLSPLWDREYVILTMSKWCRKPAHQGSVWAALARLLAGLNPRIRVAMNSETIGAGFLDQNPDRHDLLE